MAVGLVIWVLGVGVVRLADDAILAGGMGFALAYVAAAASGPPTVWVASRLIGAPLREMMVPTLLIAGVDLVLDGLVMGFAPEIYTSEPRIRFLAPLFLWTFGWACVSAFALARGWRDFGEHTASGPPT
ncbi:MAG: hypothetical protein AAGH15_23790 [Myxococcota bacterium]